MSDTTLIIVLVVVGISALLGIPSLLPGGSPHSGREDPEDDEK